MKHLFFIIAIFSYLSEVSSCVPVAVNHYAEPILPTYAGGTSTADRPQVRVIYDACQLFRSVTNEMLLTWPDQSTASTWGFTYRIAPDLKPDVCNNKCVYGISGLILDSVNCPNNTKPAKDIHGNDCLLPHDSNLPYCAPDITMRYINLCAPIDGKILAVPGICAYHTVWWNNIPKEEKLLKCFPTPAHPLPPAFCIWQADQEIKATPPYIAPPQALPDIILKFCDDSSSLEVATCLSISTKNLGKSSRPDATGRVNCEIPLPQSIPSTGTSIDINNCHWTQDNGDPFKVGPFICFGSNSTEKTPPIYEDNYKLCLYDVPVSNLSPSDIKAIPMTCQTDNPRVCVPSCGSDDSTPKAACVPCDIRLCVDMYPVTFDCSSSQLPNPRAQAECKSVKNYCMKRSDDNKGYKNFDECITKITICANDLSGNTQVTFPGIEPITCSVLNKGLPWQGGFNPKYTRYTIQPTS